MDKYLPPETPSQASSVKKKFLTIDRVLALWAQNCRKQGIPLTDAMIKEKARFFSTICGDSDYYIKANSTTWLRKFKHENGIGIVRFVRIASDINISDYGSINQA